VPDIDRVEIGYTFYAGHWQRTHVNTACKLLLFEHAFDALGCKVVGVWSVFVVLAAVLGGCSGNSLSETVTGKPAMPAVTNPSQYPDQYKTQIEQISAHLAKTEADHKAQVEQLTTHYTNEIEQLRGRIMEMNALLHQRSVNLAEDERYIVELTDRLRKQLQNTRRLSRLLEDTEDAARKLRTSRRWKLANPGATLKANLSRGKAPQGYGHLEKIVAAYGKWRTEHPEVAKIDDEIKATLVPKIPRISQDEAKATTAGSESAAATSAVPVPSVPLESLHFARHEEVDVSIIIPVFNQLEYTHACLASLQTVEEQAPFEVIIVDDCSTDATADDV